MTSTTTTTGTQSSDSLEARFLAATEGLSPEELQAIAYVSPAVHFSLFCTITDKNKQVIEPVPNILQLRMSEAYETLVAMGVRVRIIVTKPRRAGCSTFATHILYHHGMRKPCEGIAISDVKEHSTEMLDKLVAYGKTDAYPWGHTMRSTSKTIEWSNGTQWTVDSAENDNAGVGGTRQLGLFSETSKWPQTPAKSDKNVVAAVSPSLNGTDTVIISESTPEGAAGWQYETWQTAVTLEEFLARWARGIRPEEQWVKVFAAWYEFADNRRMNPVSEEEIAHIEATMTDHERDEKEKYGLSWEQLAWRRDTIASQCNGDPKKFAFYYPSNDVDCWLASGRPRFDMQKLATMRSIANMVIPEVGHLVEQPGGVVLFERSMHGLIQIFERPMPYLRYIVALDPATDESQTIGADPDRHSLAVWRAGFHDQAHNVWRPAKLVARLKPPFYGEGDEVAGHAVRLSRFYGHCIYVQEVNCGLDILRQVRVVGGVGCVKRRPFSHRTGKIEEQFGFRLNDQQERNAIIEGLAAAIREGAIEIPCTHTIDEMMAFIVKPSGRAEAGNGKHDDDVLQTAMAWECIPAATEYSVHRATVVDPPDLSSWRTVTAVHQGYS